MSELCEKLEKGRFFKLILGLGNQDLESIKKITALYAKAGVDMFDITPDKAVLKALKEGISSQELDIKDFSICVSYSIGDDKHGRKAYLIESECVKCKKCVKQCKYDAITFQEKIVIDDKKCIGCGKCICKAIKYRKNEINIEKSIKEFVDLGVNCVELHISTSKTKDATEKVKNIKKLFPDLSLSVCVSREKLSDSKLIKLLNKLIKINGTWPKLIVQADGNSMSGGNDDYESTFQSIATGQLVQDLNTYTILSGGTNSKTFELADKSNVKINGVAIGSYGRLLVKNEINNHEFWYNKTVFDSAYKKAQCLVDSVKADYEQPGGDITSSSNFVSADVAVRLEPNR